MSDSKKYYYIRLKENFFDSENIIIIESMKNGIIFSNILLKLYLKSLKTNGRLMVNDIIPYNTKMISQITRQKEKIVKEALDIFIEFRLIEILENGAIYMCDIQNFIGESSTEADRKREYDRRISEEKKRCRNVGEISEKRTPETEIEIEKETETDTKKDNMRSVSAPVNFNPSGDLFTLSELLEIAENNKIPISEIGIKTFLSAMWNSGWILYNKPVEKENIVKVLRAYLKYNDEFRNRDSGEEEEEELVGDDWWKVEEEEEYTGDWTTDPDLWRDIK